MSSLAVQRITTQASFSLHLDPLELSERTSLLHTALRSSDCLSACSPSPKNPCRTGERATMTCESEVTPQTVLHQAIKGTDWSWHSEWEDLRLVTVGQKPWVLPRRDSLVPRPRRLGPGCGHNLPRSNSLLRALLSLSLSAVLLFT